MIKICTSKFKFFFYTLLLSLCDFSGGSFAEEPYDPEKILQVPHQSILNNETLPQTAGNTGALVHQISIKVPPGQGNFQPELALVYNSQSRQNGWVGVGWRLDMGSIHRSSKRRVNFNDNDAFSHDGVDLVTRSGQWGWGWYGTKIENEFKKYKFNGDFQGWEVYHPDGKISYFGTSNQSKIKNPDNVTVRWLLDKIVDANGNTISVQYNNSGNEVYLSQITYGPSGSRVEFDLENRPDSNPTYNEFRRIEFSKRLKTIRVYGAGSQAHKYVLSYQTGHHGKSLLKSVQEYGSNFGSTTLPAITFSYQSGSAFGFGGPIQAAYGSRNSIGMTRFADVNGDGFTDMIKLLDNKASVFSGNASGNYNTQVVSYLQSQSEPGFIHFGDINGDGRSDFLKSKFSRTIEVYLADSNRDCGFNYKGEFLLNLGTGLGMTQLTDVNGDGLADFIEFPGMYGQVITRIANPGLSTGFESPLEGTLSGTNEKGRIFMADVNGDGMSDVVKTSSLAIYTYLAKGDGLFSDGILTQLGRTTDPGRVNFTDLNGDGLSDLVLSPFGSTVYTYLSDGSGKFVSEVVNSGQTTNEKGYVHLGDLNGDGFADLVKINNLTANYYIGDGNGAFNSHGSFSTPRYGYAALLDINGDRLSDFIRFETGQTITYVYLAQSLPANGIAPDLLTSINNGYDVVSSVAYKRSTSYDNVHKANGEFPKAHLPYVTYFVDNVTVNDGIGNTNIITSYDYKGAHFDKAESEFTGLGKIIQTNPNNTTRTSTYKTDDYYLKGCLASLIHEDNSGPDQISVGSGWDAVDIENGAKWVRPVNKNYTITIGGQSVSSNESYGYILSNGFGYRSRITRSGTGEANVMVDEVYSNEGSGGEWIIRLTDRRLSWNGSTDRWTVYDYDTDGNLRYETLKNDSGEQDAVTQRTYDGYGNVDLETDPNGRTTDYDYLNGTYLSRKNFQGLATVYENHNQWGRPLKVTDENNQVTTFTCDVYNRVTTEDYPGSGLKTVVYTDTSRPRRILTRINDGATPRDTYEYHDGLGRPLQIVKRGEGSNHTCSRFYYDGSGRQWRTAGPFFTGSFAYSSTFPSNQPYKSITAFDFLDRPKTINRPHDDGSTAQTKYAYGGFDRTITDPDNKSVTEKRDYLGRIKTIVDADGVSTTYAYNGAGDLTGTIGPTGDAISLTRNRLGRISRMNDPDLGIWNYTYYPNGEIKTITDAKDQVITHSYDERNRLKAKVYSNTSTPEPRVDFTYDLAVNGKGRLYSVTRDGVTVTHNNYDEMGRLTQKTLGIDGQSYEIRQSYTPAGNLSSITYPDNWSVDYEYHPGTGLLSMITGDDLTAIFSDYTPFGRPKILTRPGLDAVMTYYPLTGRIKKNEVPSLMKMEYTYSKAGDVKTINDEIRGTFAEYDYDNLHRLTSELVTGRFKNPGNRTITMDYNGSQAHAVSNVNIGGTAFPLGYDDSGNQASGFDFSVTGTPPRRLITYTAGNMPKTIEIGPEGASQTIEFTYDGNGVRVKKQGAGSTVIYADNLYEIRNGQAVKHVFAGNTRIAKITGGSTSYFHKDHLGSSMVVTDGSGSLTHSMAYAPYGTERSFLCGTDNESVTYTFTDQEWDRETGLYNYDARLYDPVIGRFLTADSVIPSWYAPQALNRYVYTLNNPLKYADPDGHEPVTLTAIGVGAIISIGIDYYGKWTQSGKSFYNYWKSGDYSLKRGATVMVAGGASAGAGGVIAKTTLSIGKKAGLSALVDATTEIIKNQIIGDQNDLGKVAASFVGGATGQFYGAGFEKGLKTFITKKQSEITSAGYSHILNEFGDKIPYVRGTSKLTPEYWTGILTGQTTGSLINHRIGKEVKANMDSLESKSDDYETPDKKNKY